MAAKKSRAKPLAAALLALEAKDLSRALHHLLSVWREVPDTELAEAIDETSKAIRSQQQPLGGKPGRERAERWEALAVEKKPEDLELLFEDLITKAAADSAVRIRRIAADHPRDPRLARWLASVCAARPFTSVNSGPFWTMVAETLVEIADPRSLTQLLAWYIGGNKIEKAKKKIAQKYPNGPPRLPEAEAKELSEIRSRLRAWAPRPTPKKVLADGAALLQAIYDEPGDLSRRLVYADFLIEQGDPRGEFIQLQVQRREGKASKGSATREKALFTEHWKQWLGGLEYIQRKGLVFEGGFVGTVRPHSKPLPAKAPEWATCTTLDLTELRHFDLELTNLAKTAPLKSLVRIIGLPPISAYDGDVTAVLASTPLAKQLEVLGYKTDRDAPELSDFAPFPKLKELWWFDRYHPLCGLKSVLENPVAARLEQFRAENDYGDVFTLRRNTAGRLSVMYVTLAKKWVDQFGAALVDVAPGLIDELHVETTVKLDTRHTRDQLHAQLERLKLSAPGL